MPLASGTRLGPYEVTGPLGAGGMGEVYRARDTRLDRTVALKILPAVLSSDPVLKQRFERGAKAVSSLNHPHICVLHDVGSQDGLDYLVMEYIDGETLAKRLEKGPLGAQRIWILPMFGDQKIAPAVSRCFLRPQRWASFAGRQLNSLYVSLRRFDGKWIAYMSAEAGPEEIYVTSFPSGTGKWQISSGGIIPPGVWGADGKELYFVGLDGNLKVAAIRESGETLSVQGVHALFRSPFVSGRVHTFFDLASKDGQRFIGSAAPDTSSLPSNVVTN